MPRPACNSRDTKYNPKNVCTEGSKKSCFIDINKSNDNSNNGTKKIYVIKRNESDQSRSLYNDYLHASKRIGLGEPTRNQEPLYPYNILLSRKWMAIIRRSTDGLYGFSINALGFAGYLLATSDSNISWLDINGPEKLLENLVDPLN